MALKDLMADLHKRVVEQIGLSNYSRKICSGLARAGFSEISIYNKFAEHIVENDLNHGSMDDDLIYLLKNLTKNVMMLKNDDRYSWLYASFSDLKKSAYDEKHFICNNCHYVYNIKDKPSTQKACSNCKTEYNRKLIKQRVPRAKATNEPVVEQNPVIEEAPAVEQSPVVYDAVYVEPVVEQPQHDPFISFNNLGHDSASGKVTLMMDVDFADLKKALDLIDPFLIPKAS